MNDAQANAIYEAMTLQKFADFYENEFVPHIEDPTETKGKIIEKIKKVFGAEFDKIQK